MMSQNVHDYVGIDARIFVHDHIPESSHLHHSVSQVSVYEPGLSKDVKRLGVGAGDRQPSVCNHVRSDVHANLDGHLKRSLDDSLTSPVFPVFFCADVTELGYLADVLLEVRQLALKKIPVNHRDTVAIGADARRS